MVNFMKKILATLVLLTSVTMLSSCGTKITYPHLEYRNSSFNFDILNRTILLEDGYVLNDGNAYEMVETESGYDLIIHFVKE